MRLIPLLVAAMLLGSTLAVAQEGPKTGSPQPPPASAPGTVTEAGPARSGVNISGDAFVGETAPDFELDGSLGRPVRLSKLRGDWVVMVFAERREGLLDLATLYGAMRRQGAQILGVCDEKAHTLVKGQEREPLPFAIVADPTGEVSSLYGLYDRIHSTTQPGFFVIDRRGVVRMSVLGQAVPPEQILELARIPMGAPH